MPSVEAQETTLVVPEKPPLPVIHIAASSGWISFRLGELWAARELMYFLVWRDVKVRYKQTALGASWAIIQPVMAMLIFTIFFGRLAKMPSAGLPYPLFAYCALVPWSYFSSALTHSSNSLVDHSRLITKVYFPRLLIPAAPVFGGLVDLGISNGSLSLRRLRAVGILCQVALIGFDRLVELLLVRQNLGNLKRCCHCVFGQVALRFLGDRLIAFAFEE